MSPKPIPEGYHTITPYIAVDDATKAIEFYKRAFGATELYIEADPFAAAFYERMGAVRVGEVPSASIPGRVLPAYRTDLSSTV